MVRVGIIGCNYGRTVLLPAFRTDSRCEIIALAGTDAARAASYARECGIPHGVGDWMTLIEREDIDAVAIATPPQIQSTIAVRALASGKGVFMEKPLAADLAGAAAIVEQASASRRPVAIDFQFAEIPAWRRAKSLLEAGAIGRLRHLAVNWNVETAATRLGLKSWKTSRTAGGGVLGNFVSHSFYYLEWLCGPITGLSARLFGTPDGGADIEATAILTLTFASGAAGSVTVSCASYLGSGHRIEFYGDEGTLVLTNTTADYMRGFELWHARRPATALAPVADEEAADVRFSDGRIIPVSRLVNRFLDSMESGAPMHPGVADGYRVQQLIEAARKSHNSRQWVEAPTEAAP